jgi:phosphate transport system permease protein
VLEKGLPVVNLHFLFDNPKDMRRAGGIFPTIVASILLPLLAIAIALPLGAGTAVYLTEYTRESRITKIIRFGTDCLAGIPSIIFGLFGFVFLVITLKMGLCILSGALTLAIMVLPIIVVATEEALKSVPFTFREAAMSVGATRWQTVRHHVLPNALPGILTGSVLALSRAIGETAPILFIANTYVKVNPGGVMDPFAALPMHIFYWTKQAKPEFHDLAASTIVVLLMILLSMNALAIIIRIRTERRRDW